MERQVDTYLKFVHFKDLQEWDLKRYFIEQIKSSFSVINLQKVIEEQNAKYDISDAKTNFGILGVNNQTGIFDAYTENGSKINQKYKKMENGWIAYNPYRVNVGSVGIKKENHKNEFISPAYVVFSCKNNLLPEFLFLAMKTDCFHKQICNSTTGSVRQNLSFEILKSLQIPLPSLAEQNTLVAAYNAKMQQAATLEIEATAIENGIEGYLLEMLGIEQAETKKHDNKNGFLQMVRFKDLERWDAWNSKEIFSFNYSTVNFGELLKQKPQYGANVKGIKKISTTRYIRITDINEDGSLNDDFVSPEYVEEQYKLHENDFLIARSGNTVGKTFLYNESFGNAIFAGYLVRYIIDVEKIYPLYLLYYTKSATFKKWIAANQRISGQPNINGQEYLKVPIPLPPLSIQNEIVAHITAQKEIIKAKKSQAEKLRKEALAEFESKIFE